MARPLRIDFEGAYHHVTVRIINRSFWLKPDKIKALFLEILKKTTLKYDTVVIAFSIMDNHLHLILKSGKTALSKFMQVLLSSFAMKYNNLMHRKGHVFESRYQSFLIEKEEYLLQAIRYVLLNPVRSGLVSHPGDYQWSSMVNYFDSSAHPLYISGSREILELFNSEESFYEYLGEYEKSELERPKAVRGIRVYGSRRYLEELVKRYSGERRQKERRISRITMEDVLSFIEQQYKVSREAILKSGSERFYLFARRLFAYLSRKYVHLRLSDISRLLGVAASTVSNMVNKLVSQLSVVQEADMMFSARF